MRPNNVAVSSNFPTQTSSASQVIWSNGIVRASVQIVLGSGSINGTFALQGSNDVASGAEPYQFTPTNWSNVGSSTTVICSTTTLGSGVFLFPATEVSYEYLRLNLTAGNAGAALGLYSARVKTLGM